jgi:hypothetical protein
MTAKGGSKSFDTRSKILESLGAICLVLFMAHPAVGADRDLQEQFTGMERGTLSGAGIDAAGRLYTVGHLVVEFQTGRLFPVMAGEQVAGLFFKGEATFRYVSEDPLEAAVVRSNVARTTRFSLHDGGFGDQIKAVLIWDPRRAAELAGDEGWPTGNVPDDARSRFDSLNRRFDENPFFEARLYLTQLLMEEPIEPAPAIARIESNKHDLVWIYDTLRDQDESIAVLKKIGSSRWEDLSGARYLSTISRQAIGRSRLEVARPRFRAVDVEVDLVNPSGERVEVEVEETYRILTPLRVLDLDLISVRRGAVDPDYELEWVKADDRPLMHIHRGSSLLVQLPRLMTAGDEIRLRFRMSGDVLYRPAGDSYWALRTEDWIPLPRRNDMQMFRYHSVIRTPANMTAFSAGETVRRWKTEDPDLNAVEFLAERAIMFPVVIAGKFRVQEKQHGDVKIVVATYANKKSRAASEIIRHAAALIDFYEKLLGEFPYPEVKIIETNHWRYHQAPPGMVFLSNNRPYRYGEVVGRWSSHHHEYLAHELAHAWWGGASPWASPDDQWLSESTAEYYSAVAMGILGAGDKFDEVYDQWRDRSRSVGDRASIYTANQLTGDDAGRERYELLYNKGPVVLHALRKEVGDDAFFTAFKSLLTNFRFKPIRTEDARAMVEFVTGDEHDEWMDRYVLGTEMPD